MDFYSFLFFTYVSQLLHFEYRAYGAKTLPLIAIDKSQITLGMVKRIQMLFGVLHRTASTHDSLR